MSLLNLGEVTNEVIYRIIAPNNDHGTCGKVCKLSAGDR